MNNLVVNFKGSKFIMTILFTLLTFPFFAQVCVKGGDQSKFPANPAHKVNGIYHFDYQIHSTIETFSNGRKKRLQTSYYVNSRDGSLFFPKGIIGMNHFNNQDGDFRFDGALILSNGQMVMYLYDKQFHKKRAFTVNSKKTANDKFMNTHTALLAFFNDRNDPDLQQENPEPLPASFDWDGITHGFTGDIYNGTDKAKMTLYLDEHPMLMDKTSVPVAGFLTGILNYFDNDKCNAIIVFSKIKQENGDYIQEELRDFGHEQFSFNATQYKPFGLLKELTSGTGNSMQNLNANMAQFQQKIMAITEKIQTLQKEKEQCIKTTDNPKTCRGRYDPQIKEARQEAKQLQYEMMKSMGAEDMMENH